MTDRKTWKTMITNHYKETYSSDGPDNGLECPTCGTVHYTPYAPREEAVDLNYYPEGYLPGFGPTVRYI